MRHTHVLGLAFIVLTSALWTTSDLQTLHAQGRTGAFCRDGWQSSATGRGACSHHGGVAKWIYERARPTDPEPRPPRAATTPAPPSPNGSRNARAQSERLPEDVSQLSTDELVTLARATERGRGVLQDDVRAIELWILAAERRSPVALARLARGHWSGHLNLIEADTELCYMYAILAMAEGESIDAPVIRNSCRRKLTDQQVFDVQRRAKAWIAAHPKR